MNNMISKRNNAKTPDIETLLVDLQKKDINYSNLSKRLKIIYMILVPFYIVIMGAELIIEFDYFVLIRGFCFVASMAIFAIIFNRYQKEYRDVNYAAPTLIMLKKAAYRYNPFRKETWWALSSVLLLAFGLALQGNELGINFSMAAAFLLGLLGGLIVGAILYIKKYKPLRDNILQLIMELENG